MSGVGIPRIWGLKAGWKAAVTRVQPRRTEAGGALSGLSSREPKDGFAGWPSEDVEGAELTGRSAGTEDPVGGAEHPGDSGGLGKPKKNDRGGIINGKGDTAG